MYRKIMMLALAAAALSACGDKKEEQPPLVCNDPAVLQSVRANIQEIIKQDARAFAQNDVRQFVDADKIIAAGSELLVTLENPVQEESNGRAVCSAGLSVQIPTAILSASQANSPLIYGDQTVSQVIQQRMMGSNLSYDGAGVFTRPLRYTPASANGQTSVNYEDNSLAGTAQTVAAALLPYGVKSILLINGQAVSLDDALRMRDQPFAEPPVAPEDILDHNAASGVFGQVAPASAAPPEVLTPAAPANEEISFSANELEQAKSNNRAADDEINGIWKRMDKAVQQRLLNEQRSWIQSKNNSCRQAAAQANTTLQAEYLQLQCDTRMTRERSQYLRGYVIN